MFDIVVNVSHVKIEKKTCVEVRPERIPFVLQVSK